jgi:hypothetical protein
MTKTVGRDPELSVLERDVFILTACSHAKHHTPIQNCTHNNVMNNASCTGDVTLRYTRKVFYLQSPIQGLLQKNRKLVVQ